MNNYVLDDFYMICDICNDNLSIVIELVHFYHQEDERISRIKSDIMEWSEIDRLERYSKTFKNILSFDIRNVRHVIAIKSGKINSQVIKIDRSKIDQHKEKQEVREHFVQSLFQEYK